MDHNTRNAFEKRISESNVATSKTYVSRIGGFMEKNGLLVGGVSLGLGMMMIGGSFLGNGLPQLKAELLGNTAPTPSTAESLVVATPPLTTAESASTAATANYSNNTATSEVKTASSSSSSSSTSAPTTSSADTATSSVQTEVVTSYADPVFTTKSIATPEVEMALPAPEPVAVAGVPAGLLQASEEGLKQALENKEPEVIPGEAIGQ